jgi:hypothetical protein
MSTNTEMTYEVAVSIFGEEVAKEMFKVIDTASAGGKGMPFPLIKRCSDELTDTDKVGDFMYNRKFERDENKVSQMVDPGSNLGDSFTFILASQAYRYERYDDVKERNFVSNIFTDLSGANDAIDASNGTPLPSNKEDRKAAGWKMTKLISGIVKDGDEWQPFSFIAKGVIYFGIGELIDSLPRKGIMNTEITLGFEIKKKGSTKFSAVNPATSSTKPVDMAVIQKNSGVIGEVVSQMAEYYDAHKGVSAEAAPAPEAAPSSKSEDW